jgi:hypothetical protein
MRRRHFLTPSSSCVSVTFLVVQFYFVQFLRIKALAAIGIQLSVPATFVSDQLANKEAINRRLGAI